MKPLTAFFPKKPRFSESPTQASNSILLPPQDESPQPLEHLEQANDKELEDYQTRLKASILCFKWCVQQRVPLTDHDEAYGLDNKGNFLALLDFVADLDPKVSEVVKENAHENRSITFHQIGTNISKACAHLTTKAIVDEIVRDNQPFSILVDEFSDVSLKKQMAIVLRYVNNEGLVLERFVGIVHACNIKASSLKTSIETFFLQYGLSMSNLRGQSYYGASKMQEKFGRVKRSILTENPSAYYVYRFAHQLHLTLVRHVRHLPALAEFFESLSMLSSTIGVSCLRSDLLQEAQYKTLLKELTTVGRETGDGLNRVSTVEPGDTRWSSYLDTIFCVIKSFPSILYVLKTVMDDVSDCEKKLNARKVLRVIEAFEFIFLLLLMRDVFCITNELSKALEKKDKDLLNAMQLVKVCKSRLMDLRNEHEKFERLYEEACDMSTKNGIKVPDHIENIFGRCTRPGRQHLYKTHHFKYSLLHRALNEIMDEVRDIFDEGNMRLLECMSSLDPSDNFRAFDKEKLIEYAKFYPADFSDYDLWNLGMQLDTYYANLTKSERFSNVEDLSVLAKLMVETKEHITLDQVYKLLKLALVLPVSSASGEGVFSAMNLVKTVLHNQIGDPLFNDYLVVYVERDILSQIDDNAIIKRFQETTKRKRVLKV